MVINISGYDRKIEKARSAKELYNLLKTIEEDKNLLVKEKHVLKGKIYDRLKKLGLTTDFYMIKAESKIEEISSIITDDMRDALEGYLLHYVPSSYHADSSRKDILLYVTELMKYINKVRKRRVDLKDLEKENARDLLDRFIRSYTQSEYTRKNMAHYLKNFGSYLSDNLYVSNFAFPSKIIIHKPPRKVRVRRMKGHARTLAQLDLFFSNVGYRVTKERREAMKKFFEFLLQTGVRPAHALLYTVGGLRGEYGGPERVKDVFGRTFIKLPFYEVVEDQKKKMNMKIVKKIPGSDIYLYEPYYMELLEITQGKDDSAPVFELKLRGVQRHCKTLSRIIGVENLSPYDFRHTWASVIYHASGHNVKWVSELGGWGSEFIPIDHYIEIMTPEEAVDIAKKYSIYLPKEIAPQVDKIEAGRSVDFLLEEINRLKEKEKKLIEELSKLRGG